MAYLRQVLEQVRETQSVRSTPTSREVVVVSGVRTAIGTFGGSLKDSSPTERGALVVREALARASTGGKDVDHVVITEPEDMYLSRVAAINGG